MGDYRCRDMQTACNHAGHIDALEQLVDTQASCIRELRAASRDPATGACIWCRCESGHSPACPFRASADGGE